MSVSKDGFIQINIVVRDIEKAARKWGELLGIPTPEIRINHLEGGENYTYRGEPVSCDLKVADIPMNGFVIELHEPIGGGEAFYRPLRRFLRTAEQLGGGGGEFVEREINVTVSR